MWCAHSAHYPCPPKAACTIRVVRTFESTSPLRELLGERESIQLKRSLECSSSRLSGRELLVVTNVLM